MFDEMDKNNIKSNDNIQNVDNKYKKNINKLQHNNNK